LYISLSSAVSLTSVVFSATTDVAIGGSTRVGRVGSAISEGSMNFHISLLLANAIVLIINKNGSQESEWTSTTGFVDMLLILQIASYLPNAEIVVQVGILVKLMI
jgi:hypothetical protein